jgi:hypothetical protein
VRDRGDGSYLCSKCWKAEELKVPDIDPHIAKSVPDPFSTGKDNKQYGPGTGFFNVHTHKWEAPENFTIVDGKIISKEELCSAVCEEEPTDKSDPVPADADYYLPVAMNPERTCIMCGREPHVGASVWHLYPVGRSCFPCREKYRPMSDQEFMQEAMKRSKDRAAAELEKQIKSYEQGVRERVEEVKKDLGLLSPDLAGYRIVNGKIVPKINGGDKHGLPFPCGGAFTGTDMS